MRIRFLMMIAAVAGCITGTAVAEEVGSVSTTFKLLGPNNKIAIEAFDDPKVPGVACYVSRAKTGGISGAIGLAEDPSDSALACRKVGPIKFDPSIVKDGERVFQESASPMFKTVQVVRFYDRKRNALVYLVYSDKLIDGSPKSSVSAVPLSE